MTVHGQTHFHSDLKALIERYRKEYLLTYAEMVGVLEIAKRNLMESGCGCDEEPEETLD